MLSFKFLLIKFYLLYILLIHRFWVCKFAYLLKFICNPRISICGTFAIIHGQVQKGEKFESPDIDVTSWGWAMLFSCAHTINKYPFHNLSATFLCLKISCFKMALRHYTEGLSIVSQVQELWCALQWKYIC